ncbi:hypothetical protein ILUMI_18666 [Ignelater luminosus]|uniref:Uncharacterized protein n=1 Tax=Ignelater luminosus TaxID=2038154 RepID=A0A8K0CLN0_IGNLU|nr:hypothetical protein ILUMI_18666 [Ignelater luminosus]
MSTSSRLYKNVLTFRSVHKNHDIIVAIAEDHNENDKLANTATPQKYQWYVSPRLGRKKKNVSPLEETHELSSLNKEQLESLLDNIQEPPGWTAYTISDGKPNSNFVPRLGRELIEETDPDTIWIYDADLNRELITQRSPPFTPRLGRGTNNKYHFDPRLGKRNSNLQKQLL